MARESKYDPFIFLSTRVIQAGSDMIEEIGRLEGIRSVREERDFMPYHMSDLRKAIAKAQSALVNYDACIAAKVDALTSDEFNVAAKETA